MLFDYRNIVQFYGQCVMGAESNGGEDKQTVKTWVEYLVTEYPREFFGLVILRKKKSNGKQNYKRKRK